MDMDLDDLLDGPAPAEAPSRPSRFAPKGAKAKPKPKTEKLPEKKEEPAAAIELPIVVKNEVKKEEVNDLMETEEMVAPDDQPEEDEVVREIDVYFNPSIDQDTLLYVLQYPLRPVWRPYELDDRCEEVRVRPTTREVEIDLALDVHSKNYDGRADPRVQMSKQTLESTWQPPPASGYAVGVLKGNQLHLNPVHAVVQLRPSMRHLDPKESRRKADASNDGEKKVKVEEPAGGTSSKASKKVSTPVVQTNDGVEDWVPLKYHGVRSDKASRYLHKMAAGECLPIHFPMSSCDYLDNLCPGTSIAALQSRGPPRRSLLILPLEERFKIWLREGPPVQRFDCLKYLAPEETVEEVLGVLVEYAVLVQGLWIPKTKLFGDEGMEAAVRDRVLHLFSKNVLISNSKLPQPPKLAKAMREVLNVFAVERPTFNDWKLKETPDMNFIKSYPSIVEQQREDWNRVEKGLRGVPGLIRSEPGVNKLPESNTTNNPAKSSIEVGKRIANGANSRRTMSEEAREAISRALLKFFKVVKVCSLQHMSRLLREIALSEHQRSTPFAKEAEAAADSINAFPEDFQAIMGQLAVNIHGVWVPKSSPEYPQYDSLRKVVLDLLLAGGPTAKLKKATILEAVKVELKRDEVPQADVHKVLNEICKSQGTAWVLKPGDGSPNH